MKNPPFLNLFWRLRDAGMKLDISQYELATQALLASLEMGLDISDKQAIARIYRTIWAKSREEQKLFDNCLNELLSQQKNLFSEFHQFIKTSTNNYIPEVTAAEEEIIENSSTSNSEIPPESTFEPENFSESSSEEISDSKTFSEVPPQPNFEPEISPQQIPESETFPEIFLPPTVNNPQVATAIPKTPKDGDYFPVSLAQIQQAKRLLFQPQLTGFSRDLNVQATVKKIAKEGFFLQPIYKYSQGKPRKILLLIDQSDSMMPFNPFCRLIINNWQGAEIYYFDNVPKIRVYADSNFSEKKSLKTLLAGLVKEEILVLILSDGGAARGRFVSERVEKTENFLKFISRKVERVAWLNPLPREKWRRTSAEEIYAISNDNFNLKTFGLNYQEFKAMSEWLIYGKTLVATFHETSLQSFSEVEIVNENVDPIAAFSEYFGESHLIFAQHAAFPLALTPDLLYRLWQRFFARERNFNIPWYAVADILLSSFCHTVDRELYEMDRGIRNQLLQLCTERFGESRLEELSQFLVSYIDSQVKGRELVSSIWQGQRWTALAYTRPELAARQLAESLQEAYGRDDKAELVRLSSLMETLAEPLREYEPLLMLGQGYSGYARGDVAGVENVRRELERSEVDVGGVLLRVPVALPLKTFSFEVITVNRRGEEINRVPKQAQYFTEDLGNGVILEMVAIPGGSFLMGSPESEEGRLNTESPQHQVTLQPFYMSKYPITQEQYQAIMGTNPSHFKAKNHSVEGVTWYNATNFCHRLSQKTGKIYKLPSESQWEYACRAGTTTPFYFGETITTDLVNYNGNYTYASAPKGRYRQITTDVGSFPSNAFGLYDLHGNVWEWCQDIWHDNYEGSPIDGSAWVTGEDNHKRVLRGGSWYHNPRKCRSTFRHKDIADYYFIVDYSYRGFRVVCSSINPITNQSDSAPNTQKKKQQIILPSTKPEPIITPQLKLPLKTFSFEVITVNRTGEEINRVRKQAQYFTEDLGNSVILEMVAIPGGTFIMGSPEDEARRDDTEGPQHHVTVPPFFIAKYPITQGQWRAIAQVERSSIASRTDLKVNQDLKPDPSRLKKSYQGIDRWQRPVERVNWYEAVEFCERLSKITGKNYRLPTEAEWEYACRAGTTTPFHFGETITGDLANYIASKTYGDEQKGKYREETTPVGQFPPNAFGLYDLKGNVWEWCADEWHDNYENAPIDGKAWLNGDDSRSPLRGGSWGSNPSLCRCASRYYNVRRDFRVGIIGFRIVCDGRITLSNQSDSSPNTQPKQQPIILPSTKPEPIITPQLKLPLKTFSFEVVTVNRRGKEINRVCREAKYFTEDLGNGVILEMVAIPGGTFIMGAPESEEGSKSTERPQHDVNISKFLMGRYPITQAQWKAIASRIDLKINLDLKPDPSRFQKPYQGIDRWQRPVERINWYEAVEFCERLSKLTGKNYRLPTEAEWEYACRAGTTTPFHFGETITTELANYRGKNDEKMKWSGSYGEGPKGESRQQTTPVGYFDIVNSFGLSDMHGNVWEWCADERHGNYENAPTDGKAWLNGDDSCSQLRGGSWFVSPGLCRSASRSYSDRRDDHYVNVSFRLVCDTPDTQPKQQQIILPTTKPEAIITPQLTLPLKTFSFEVITVNRRGEEISRVAKQAEYFTEDLGNGVILEMVAIPSGTFLMGSPENEERKFNTESPQHQVNLQPFYMSKYPITQEQYLAVMDKNPSHFKGINRPVETVTWYNATEFCQKLSQKTTKIYQLPSESQWEYACRAGTTTPFYFGETITSELVNYNGHYTYRDAPQGRYREQTTNVGSFPPNAFGLYDMHGNVWEWCQDIWHNNYEGAPTDGSARQDRDTDSSPLRGGSWYDHPDFCRSAIRVSYFGRVFRYDYFGFRIVFSPIIPHQQESDRQQNKIS